MISLFAALILAAPFPLPAIDGKAPAVTEKQKTFRLPMRFEKVKAFYAEQLKAAEITQREATVDGRRVLTITTKATTESWTKAVIREGEVDTSVDVTPVLRLAEEEISGNARPLVQFVFGRSPAVDQAVKAIDHTEQMRAK